MKQLTILGRILFGLPFGILGLNHFFMKDFYLGMLTSFIPGMGFTVMLVGLALIVASVCIIFNKFVRIACFLLAFLLALFILTIHIPNIFVEKNSTIAMIELMKDTSLMGGALLIAGIFDQKKEDGKS
jgi:putative oxidoreductase